MAKMWQFRSARYSGPDRLEPLELSYEVNCSPISDDYDPDEADAKYLLRKWVDYLTQHDIPGPDVSIYWSVLPVHESAPFQPLPFNQSFLTYFTWPVDPATGERLQWSRLPVRDMGWRPAVGRKPMVADKGGFIQEATGWKPSPLQRSVHLPSLLLASGFAA